MNEDWDLFAVVRGCSNLTPTTNTTTNTITTTTNPNTTQNAGTFFDDYSNNAENPMACLASLTFDQEYDPFAFPNLVLPNSSSSNNNNNNHCSNGFDELQDSYKPFLSNPTTTDTTTTTTTTITANSQGMIPSFSDSDFGGLMTWIEPEPQQQLQPAPNTSISAPPAFNPTTSPIFVYGESSNHQQPKQSQLAQQLQQQQATLAQQLPQQQPPQLQKNQQQAEASSSNPLRPLQAQASRSRKRKNQQKRMVCHVTADNLSADLWAWRKYGQKPIKGSPYPRNYYRCSSSKGCGARKQVERSHTDPETFIVTYSGDHSHPRPTHRNSLAGSTRTKPNNDNNNNNQKAPIRSSSTDSAQMQLQQQPIMSNIVINTIASCSSPMSNTSLSPTTPLPVAPPALVDEETLINVDCFDPHIGTPDEGKEREEMIEEMFDDDDDDREVDEDGLLIPDMAMNEDFFMGLLGHNGAGASSSGADAFGQSPTNGDNFSPWN